MSDIKEKKISIVGAGLVGSFLAIWLRQKGCVVEVFEKRRDPRLPLAGGGRGGRSINLIVTSRGLNALEKTGLLTEVMKIVVPVYGRSIHSREGQIVYQPYGRDRSECNYSISRSELNELLINKAQLLGVKIHFEQSLVKLNLENKTAIFNNTNGPSSGSAAALTEHPYELLISAEGAGSVARRELIKTLGSGEIESTEWLESDYKELFLPASSIDKNALHIWPRGSHMLMALPNRDGSFTMTLYLPKKGSPASFEELRTKEEVKSFFQAEFGDAASLMPDYIEDFLKNPQGVLGTVRSTSWVYKDSFALIGDAAHAIVPFFGQGMNLGFEDCTVFMRALENAGGDWGRALASYESEQRPNANAIADMALENFIEMRDKTARLDFQLRKRVEAAIESKFSDVYRSRYGMITYTLIPFALAQEAGRIQDQILNEICAVITDPAALDFDFVKRLIERHLTPFMVRHNLSVNRYRPN